MENNSIVVILLLIYNNATPSELQVNFLFSEKIHLLTFFFDNYYRNHGRLFQKASYSCSI